MQSVLMNKDKVENDDILMCVSVFGLEFKLLVPPAQSLYYLFQNKQAITESMHG